MKFFSPLRIIAVSLTNILVACIVIFFLLFYRYPTTSPVTALADYFYTFLHPHKAMKGSVIAFLPYWRLTDTTYAHFDVLSEVVYFSLTVDGNGNFITAANGQEDPGWRWWQSTSVKDFIAKTQITGGTFTFTVANLQNKTISLLLTNPHAQNALVNNIAQEIIKRNLDGVNIDFEYSGTPENSLKGLFSTFSQILIKKLHMVKPSVVVSLDVTPMGARKDGLFDFPYLSNIYDKFIVMTYDFYNNSSETAGPIAPLYGFAEKKFLFDVQTTVADYKKVLPSQKIILGIPYYGWDWPVTNGKTYMSKTLDQTDDNGYPEVLSYGRMKTDKSLITSQCLFDVSAQEPWCWYIDSQTKKEHQVWFENEQSIAKKLQFEKKNSLGGVAIWTLGYDKSYEDLWNLLYQYFARK